MLKKQIDTALEFLSAYAYTLFPPGWGIFIMVYKPIDEESGGHYFTRSNIPEVQATQILEKVISDFEDDVIDGPKSENLVERIN